jgi:hypothetical protein
LVTQLCLVAVVLLQRPHRLAQVAALLEMVAAMAEKVVIVAQSWAHLVMDMQVAVAAALVDMLERVALAAMLLVHLQLLVKPVQLAQAARPVAEGAAEICAMAQVKDPMEQAANIQAQVPLEMAVELVYMVQM